MKNKKNKNKARRIRNTFFFYKIIISVKESYMYMWEFNTQENQNTAISTLYHLDNRERESKKLGSFMFEYIPDEISSPCPTFGRNQPLYIIYMCCKHFRMKGQTYI